MATTEASSTVNYLSDPSDARVIPPHTIKPAERLLDIGSIFRIFWRRKNLFIGIVTLLTMVALAGLSAVTPQYTAQTDVIIESREHQIADLKAVLGDVLPDKEGLLSEIEVLRSRASRREGDRQVKLDRDPEFNEGLGGRRAVLSLVWRRDEARRSSQMDSLKSSWPFSRQQRPAHQRARPSARERDKLIDAFLEQMAVSVKRASHARHRHLLHLGGSRKGGAHRRHPCRRLHRRALEAKFQATARANKWLAGKLQDLRKQVAAVGRRRRRISAARRAAAKQGRHLISQQVADLNTADRRPQRDVLPPMPDSTRSGR